MQGDSESKTFHYGKRIPSAIPKLRRSSACVNRYPGQAGTACDFVGGHHPLLLPLCELERQMKFATHC